MIRFAKGGSAERTSCLAGDINYFCFNLFSPFRIPISSIGGKSMTRSESHPLPQPLFQEPVFDDGKVSADPTGFVVDHPSDDDVYKEIENLLKTKVVGFEKSRIGPDEQYTLSQALGARGPDVVSEIEKAGRIVFHAIGDSGATTDGEQYSDELTVADQLTMDSTITETKNRPAFLLHLADKVTVELASHEMVAN
jgi:hypothetical protein